MDDDSDMLELYNLFRESSEADINQLVHELQKFGMLSLNNDVSEVYLKP